MGATSFSWRNVAASTVAGAVTAGFGAATSGAAALANPVVRAMATGAVGNLSNYAANKLAGNDVGFSWRSVAASVVSAAITAEVVPALGSAFKIDPNSMPGDLLAGITGGVVSAHVRQGLVGGGVDYSAIAADAFGNALANAAGRSASAATAIADGGDFRSRYPYALASLDGGGTAITDLDPIQVSLHRDAVTGDWDSAVWNAENRRWITSSEVVLNADRTAWRPAVQQWGRPPTVASWTNGYGAGAPVSNWQMTGVHSVATAPKNYTFPAKSLGEGLWNSFADAQNAGAATAREMWSGVELPFTDSTLGQTSIGERLIETIPMLPQWNSRGIARAFMPNIVAWAENGFALRGSPLDLMLGQWKGGVNFLSDSTESIINGNAAGQLTRILTGYQLDLPRFDIGPGQQMGAAMFDGGALLATAVAPGLRAGQAAALEDIAAGAVNARIAVGVSDTIPAGQRLILRPIQIEFPASGLTEAQQKLFSAHLLEQQSTLNRLSLTRTNDLELNLANYPNVQPQIAASRRMARDYLPGDGRGLDAAHALDSVAGGYVNEFAGFRSPIQQRIGALWRTRADQIVPGREHLLVPKYGEK
ncbi:hypothetical protein NB717_001069 [Xanthomonas sacchari]|nr:hypothetical protein [Xanthomonas sacchari]